ncbi:hypothetical protein H072_11174 [Dactylellina haptotyla CBS 200.50]|uniref:G-protein coupled receptors family 2 profile 2 domain-containing protein n=1 Tax=Dactylellina haptotyla (strain CBS 200.50) TaxID=1284197 RepID=S8B8R5_DACHA|nr:hypothetical protein H072_11174 [Dactylellina haptotyla CBS 200.50]
MMLPDLLDRRSGALAAPATAWGDRVLNQVLFAVALSSALGAGWVMLSYACIKELRSYRHQLILGLAVSDFLMAVNFMFSAGFHVGGDDLALPENKTTCTVNGFLTQVFVVQTDWWILIIAIVTYIILGNFKSASHFMQTHVWIPWLPPWIVSIIIAVVCQAVVGYGYIGGWCWLTSDMNRLLVNFIPRWIIVIAIAIIYARLYMIVRKARKWDMEDRNPIPSDDVADTSVILVTVSQSQKRHTIGTIGRTAGDPPAYESGEVSSYSQRVVFNSASMSHGQNQPLNADQLKRIAKKMMVYPLAYAIIWACPTSIRIYQGVTGLRAPLWVTILDKSCIVVQGLIDAIVYGLNERAWQGWRDHINRVIYENQGGQIIG